MTLFFHAIFVLQGAHPIPLVSPAVSFLFDESLSFAAIREKLRQRQIRFIILTSRYTVTEDFYARHRFLRELRQQHKPIFHALPKGNLRP